MFEMPIRFLEYVKTDDKFISMYVVQEVDQSKKPLFKVNIRDGKEVVTLWVENGDHGWQINPRDLPPWIGEIRPLLVHKIESRLANGTGGSSMLDQTG
jgi:hypothetical protein